jgi:hypothetical protein
MRQAEYHTKIDKQYLSSCTWKTSCNQAVSAIVPFVPFGCSGPRWLGSIPQSLHSTKKANTWPEPVKANWRKQNKQLFFLHISLSSSHGQFLLRSAYASTMQLHFVTLRGLRLLRCSTVLCLPPYIFLAVAPSRSHRGGSTHNLQLIRYWLL